MVATILIARWGTESRSPGAVRAALSLRRRRGTQFILCQYPVAVLVELLQGSGCVGHFLLVNHPVAIRIKGEQERAGWRWTMAGPRAAWATILRRRGIGWRRSARILRREGES